MQRRTPDYYEEFHCIGSACRDNCCIGWEIDIDRKTAADYRSQPGAFGDRLRGAISEGDNPHFLLAGERCPFLNQQNLCDIITQLGDEHLCGICDQHPRFSEWFTGVQETGLGLCCEAAAKLILTRAQPMQLVETALPDSPQELPDPAQQRWEAGLFTARNTLLALLQNRRQSLPQRVGLALCFGEALQACLEEQPEALPQLLAEYADPAPLSLTPGSTETQLALYQQLVTLYESLEPLDAAWPVRLASLKSRLSALVAAEQPAGDAIAEEQLLVYFVFRYFMKAAFDGDPLGKLHLAVASWLLLRLLQWAEDAPSTEGFVQLAKSYSKEVEYDEENLERLAAASRESPLFGLEQLLGLL